MTLTAPPRPAVRHRGQPRKLGVWTRARRAWQLYLLLAPVLAYFAVFKYWPMYGVQIAFRDYRPDAGFLGSPWVGVKHFARFFNSFQFWDVFTNTVLLALFNLAVVFPVPILLALLVNQLPGQRFKRLTQTVLYAPTFISTVVVVGMLYVFLAPRTGLVNNVIVLLGGEPIFFMGEAEWFRPVYVASSLWQEAGFQMVVYLAALAGIDPSLHEAAKMDGASRRQRIRHVDLPGIAPTISVLFILAVGNLLNIGFEKALLMQTPLNESSSQIIQTYVYEAGLKQAQFSFSAAVGLFNSMINLALLLTFNSVARKARQGALL
ncbi:ABC transporter permease [Nonomuraea turcica]|uniref:ABC transporter permease n=1 Tax=Nonomuraea sp. G32 TaxID=3067274 RepID=UPI00273B0381|nr:ABC transporter permease subunit [Nonomuraea sp. G32]MDP4504354.1 ABC transporter permease subunit [Nonomuraea sp. G32]